MRLLMSAFAFCVATSAAAQAPDARRIVQEHVLPRYQMLADDTSALMATAQAQCVADSAPLRAAYHTAFDAWIGVSHLRFGPSEQNDRGFALAFWPDPRGSTPKTLATLIQDQDPVAQDADAFATVSVAARGFYALEFLLFDAQFAEGENAEYRCVLTQAITRDIAANAQAILSDWQNGYAALMTEAGNDTYRTDTEAAQQLFTALSTGLEFTSGTRIARPLGTFDRPRPNRAEARRSERSLRHVVLSLEATRELAALISGDDAAVDAAFEVALGRAQDVDDPVFGTVADPQSRFRVEVLQQSINSIRRLLAEEIGPRLGITAGFNSLDGD
ncbi:MAG: imelysin family protein [Pseudomonadota bacterium]